MKKRGREMKGNKGQVMGMPFQFIFALIIIAIAFFVGFYVIKMFLDRAEQANINDFVKNQLETQVQAIWSGPEEASIVKNFVFSRKFDSICFLNQSKTCSGNPDLCSNYRTWQRTNTDNLFLMPLGTAEKYDTYSSWHVKCGTRECISFSSNPLCIPVVDGKVSVKLTKESGKNYVTISQA